MKICEILIKKIYGFLIYVVIPLSSNQHIGQYILSLYLEMTLQNV